MLSVCYQLGEKGARLQQKFGASVIAKEHGVIWRSLGFGEPTVSDALLEPTFEEAVRLNVKPEVLAGIYDLPTHEHRERLMYEAISLALQTYDCVLGIVGYTHLGVLAQLFEARQISVKALLFTYPLVVDETRS